MSSDRRLHGFSLSVQVITTLVVLIILASLAVGGPGIWLMRAQLDQLAWALVSQASRTTHALLVAQQSELGNLAILTAQRPTLWALLYTGDASQLMSYLATLKNGAGLDLLLICKPDRQLLIQVGELINGTVCNTVIRSGIYTSQRDITSEGWLLASETLAGETGYRVVVGQKLGTEFLESMREQTGVEQVFLIDGQTVGGTVVYNSMKWEDEIPQPIVAADLHNNGLRLGTFNIDGSTHYAARGGFAGSGLETIVALPVTGIMALQKSLTWLMGSGIAVVILLTSVLGFALAKRISQPLDQLRDAAIDLRKGNLAHPIAANYYIREVAQVAYALEDSRIALKHSLEQLRLEKAWGDHLLKSVVEGIITLDRQNRITFFSRGAEQITGLTQEQVLRKSIDEVFPVQDGNEGLSSRIHQPGGMQEIVNVQIGERSVTLAITGAKLAPTKAGSAHRALVLRDVSNEEAIRRLLGDFLANVTHEFRTPLTAQAVSIELLLDQLDKLNTSELRELLTAHYLGVLSLQTLIDNLLEGASIEAGRFRVTPQPTELIEVVTKAVETIQPLLDKYCLHLQLEVAENLPLVQADARRTSQVLINLLSNAIKWSVRDGEIRLTVEAEVEEMRICVVDQGPGIPAEQKRDLFTWLPNLPTKNGRADYGAGLGLSVVRAIVEAQGGRVGVADGPDKGAVFWFTIPIVGPVTRGRA